MIAQRAKRLAIALRKFNAKAFAAKWMKYSKRLKQSTRDGKTYARTMYWGFIKIAPEATGSVSRLRGIKRVVRLKF